LLDLKKQHPIQSFFDNKFLSNQLKQVPKINESESIQYDMFAFVFKITGINLFKEFYDLKNSQNNQIFIEGLNKRIEFFNHKKVPFPVWTYALFVCFKVLDISSDLVPYIDPLTDQFAQLFQKRTLANYGMGGYFYEPQDFQFQNKTLVKYKGTSPLVILPNYIETIADYAFKGAKNLSQIILSNQIKSIGEGAFEDCVLLKTMKLPSSIKHLSKRLFINCSSLT